MSQAVVNSGAHLAHERFEDADVQAHAARLGMWVFLVSEVLLFATLFTLYAAQRAEYPRGFAAAAHETDLLLGSVNTYVLLTASFLVALAVGAIRGDRPRPAAVLLVASAGLGVAFLGLKGLEYAHHFRDGLYPGTYYRGHGLADVAAAREFFALYYVMTGLHALHVIGGIFILLWLAWRTRRGAYGTAYHTPVELGGMYWHLVDVIWLFLWPAFYLLR
jgi:cytochrome c oxidase subunit 3